MSSAEAGGSVRHAAARQPRTRRPGPTQRRRRLRGPRAAARRRRGGSSVVGARLERRLDQAHTTLCSNARPCCLTSEPPAERTRMASRAKWASRSMRIQSTTCPVRGGGGRRAAVTDSPGASGASTRLAKKRRFRAASRTVTWSVMSRRRACRRSAAEEEKGRRASAQPGTCVSLFSGPHLLQEHVVSGRAHQQSDDVEEGALRWLEAPESAATGAAVICAPLPQSRERARGDRCEKLSMRRSAGGAAG